MATKLSLLCVLVLLCGSGSPAVFGQVSEVSPVNASAITTSYDVASFTAELHRLSAALEKNPSPAELTVLRNSLPVQWSVATSERSYPISSAFLRDQFKSGALGPAKTWVDHLLAEIEGYSAGSAGNPAEARAELNHILAGPEFAAVRPPSAWELFRQRLAAWIGRLLEKILGALRYPIGGKILFWLVLMAAVGCVALWVFRFMVSRDSLAHLSPAEITAPSRTWQEWIHSAREAASRGDYREAVHSAYWAGIVRMEDTGVVPKDRTKTPREYLQIAMQSATHELVLRPVYREPITALTSCLERIWYANRGATLEDFHESLRLLEALGCRLE